MSSNPEIQSIDCTSEDEMKALGAKLLLHSTLSQGVELLHFHHQPAELSKNTSQQHLILINTHVLPNTHVEQVTEGYFQEARMRIEDVIIVPAKTISSACWDKEHSYLALCLDPVILERQAKEIMIEHVELLPQFALQDALLHSLGIALKNELEVSFFGERLYIDSLVTTLTAHLLRHYCARKPIQIITAGLPKTKLKQVLEYIKAHINEELTLVELATIAQVSPNYFATLFKQSTGLAPHQYVIKQRIDTAKELMIAGKVSLAEVAAN
ncbi:Transcriptional Regulator, AraC family [Calothrix sp. PCC 7716]|nr:Transcriptional Regulator, AraC family [Calothrix sp. PCC 7716]